MATARNDSIDLYYERDGQGDPVAFVSEAGLGGWSWAWQHAAIAGPYESIVWDLRGTGRSDAPPGPYDIETLVADFEAVLDACNARKAHVVACGLGGTIALTAARTTNRLETLTLFGTAATGDAFDLSPLIGSPENRDELRNSLESAFSSSFRSEQPAVLSGIADWRADGDASLDGWEAQVAALAAFDATDWLVEVTQPTLVAHGTADELVPVAAGRSLARDLPRGDFVPLSGAGHLGFIEHSRVVNDRLIGFLEANPIESGGNG